MPSSPSYSTPGEKTSYGPEFILGGVTYSTKVESTVDQQKKVTASKLTLRQNATGRSGVEPNPIAVSYDGGKTWQDPSSSGKSGVKPLVSGQGITAEQIKSLQPGGSLNRSVTNSAEKSIKSNGAKDTQVNQVLGRNQAPAAGITTSGSGSFASVKDTAFEIANLKDTGPPKFENVDYCYPLTAKKLQDFDFIQFSAYQYGPRAVDASGFSFAEEKRSITNPQGKVRLPIQPGISESNSVAWTDQSMNPVQIAAAGLAIGGITEGVEGAKNALTKSLTTLKAAGPSVQKMVDLYFAQEATKTNIATKFSGAILNPNMELLFQGPQLRPFTYSFRLSPRDNQEASEVKRIIRYFKQNMAPQRGAENLFLKTPNVFKIDYCFKGKINHPGLHRIKNYCALQNFTTDYTPENSYMTFVGENGSMVSYNITLTFMELEPVYADDYDKMVLYAKEDQKDIIGY
jgi:hypothetical protein